MTQETLRAKALVDYEKKCNSCICYKNRIQQRVVPFTCFFLSLFFVFFDKIYKPVLHMYTGN